MKSFNSKFFVLSSMLMLLLCQFVFAQEKTLFKKIAPVVFDTAGIYPDAFAIGDIDGDGFEDLILTQSRRKPLIFYYFKPDTADVGMWDFHKTHNMEDSVGIARDSVHNVLVSYGPVQIIDSNNDGKNEFFFHYSSNGISANGYKYDSTALPGYRIVTQSLPSGFAWSSNGSLSWAFIDFNNDGMMDAIQGVYDGKTAQNLLISNVFTQNSLPRERIINTDITKMYGRTLGLYAYDFNKDGWVDVFEASSTYPQFTNMQDFYYMGSETGLMLNESSLLGGYTIISGAAIGDYDNDGLLDVYELMAGGSRVNVLYKNKGDHRFEKTDNVLTRDLLDSRSAMWGDFNNDGLLDLVIAEYNGAGGTGAYPSLFVNLGPDANGVYSFKKRLINSLPELDMIGNWNKVAFVDIDRDGDLDVLLTGKQAQKPILIFQNQLMQSDTLAENTKRWIGFDLISKNTFSKLAINAKLTLKATINGKVVHQYRELQPFHGFLSQQTRFIHFGLGDATTAEVQIQWPSGTSQTIKFNSLSELNQYHVVTEPDASKLVLKSEQPFLMSANLEETLRDTIRFENIGSGELKINAVNSKKGYLQVESFSKTIASKERGYIALVLYTENSNNLGIHNDTLVLKSNVSSGDINIVLKTTIQSRPARFSKVTASEKEPFLSEFNTFRNTVVADFNSDGLIDIFAVRKDSLSRLYYQDENGQFYFEPGKEPNIRGNKTRMVATADLNEDGIPDLVFANMGTQNTLLLSSESGFTQKSVPAFNTARMTQYIVAHDLNHDGRLDLLIGNTSSQSNQILINQPVQNFNTISLSGDEFTRNLGYTSFLKVFDWDDDGLDDIFAVENGNPEGDRIRFYKQTDSLVFKEQALSGVSNRSFSAKGMHIFDFNNDGYQDILLVSALSSTPSILLKNTGEALVPVFTEILSQIPGIAGDVTIFDFNMDGYQDIFFANEDYSENNVLLQSVAGNNFLILNSGDLLQSAGKSSTGASLIDWNGDAKPDLIISNYLGSLEVYQNDLSENNWVGILPDTKFMNGKSGIIPGLEVDLTLELDGRTQTLTRKFGYQSLFSQNYQAIWFGMGKATSATYQIKVPGSDIQETGTITKMNDYNSVEVLGVSAQDEVQLPNAFTLNSVFPNPFNPDVNVSFTIPQSGKMNIRIYDILGRLVRNDTQNYTEGRHQLMLRMEGFSSGIYLLQLNYQGETHTRKITLLR